MRSAIEMIGILCSKAICCRIVMPAIEPSFGSNTVDRTDTGRRPANATRLSNSFEHTSFSVLKREYMPWSSEITGLGIRGG
jgi:hypothetical protein